MVNGSCTPSPNTDYEVYHRFFEEHDLEEGRLLADLSASMLLEKDILELGDRVRAEFVRVESNGTRSIVFAAYPGTASVFAVVARQLDGLGAANGSLRSAVYVSSVTYACNLDTTQPHNCLVMNYTSTKARNWFLLLVVNTHTKSLQIICAFSVFVGLYVAFFGHRQFKSSQFFFGFVGGCLMGYIALARLSPLSYNWTLIATGGIGAAGSRCPCYMCLIDFDAAYAYLQSASLGSLCGSSSASPSWLPFSRRACWGSSLPASFCSSPALTQCPAWPNPTSATG
jgi:hypothetical protein